MVWKVLSDKLSNLCPNPSCVEKYHESQMVSGTHIGQGGRSLGCKSWCDYLLILWFQETFLLPYKMRKLDQIGDKRFFFKLKYSCCTILYKLQVPREVQSSIRVASESWRLLSSHCRAK